MRNILPRDDLLGEKQLGNLLHVIPVLRQEFLRPLMGRDDHLADFSIKRLPCLLAERFRPTLPLSLTTTVADRANDVIHPVVRARFERHPRDLLKVVLGTRCDVLRAKEDFLSYTTAEGHANPIRHLWCREEVAIWGEVLQAKYQQVAQWRVEIMLIT